MAKMSIPIFILSTLISVTLASQKVTSAYLTYQEKTKTFELHQNEELLSSAPWVVKGSFSNQINETGWSYLTISSSSDFPDNIQAYFAGYLEASLTRELISQTWINNVEGYCTEPYIPYCQRLYDFLQENMDWMNEQIKAKAATDPYWHMVELFLYQVSGITDGYFNVTPQAGSTNLDPFGFYMLQISGDMEDLESVLGKEDLKSHVFGSGSCSALIKLLPGFKDLYVSHDTWSGFQTMLRVLKKYDFAFRSTSQTKDLVPGQTMTFSSYPGTIYSGDDYFLISSGLASLETTIGNSNNDLWKYVKPTGGVLEGIRTMAANRLAKTGDDWAKIFSQFNSGTYNNQWLIVDYNKFEPGVVPSKGLLTILEQIPGFIMHMDITELLMNQTYWPSYNIPFCEKIFNMSGQQENVAKYGDWFTYDKSPRAQIFRRDNVLVSDLESMTRLMRQIQ
ncbi:hypothetical protein ACJMK2_012631 [Sinanodonta woodiana]|uniref:Phospholipase B-like n=1 Tax=Sinanodonta woodiana TaxID=1069815 RepID=A0ABD3V922_SINWO